jgi:Cu/Ag efflux protein CusF
MRYALAAALVFGFGSPAFAQSGHDHSRSAAPAERTQGTVSHRALGLVKSVNAEKATAVIAHEPVVSLKWPAMTMVFKTSDRALLQELKAGTEVNFEFEQRGRDYVITAVNPGWAACSADCPMNKK